MDLELRARRDSIEHLWKRGLSGRMLLSRYTEVIDGHLRRQAQAHLAGTSGITLAAVGGYGRGELFPYSDIDLLVLYDHCQAYRLEELVQDLLYPLWDIGIETGHSVRTPEEAINDAQEDFHFQVALLDLRFLAGDQALLRRFQERYHQGFIEGARSAFLKEMLSQRQDRRRRFGGHGFRLEPHVKESPGGLRDIQSMFWTSQVLFSIRDLPGLMEAGLLSRRESERFQEAHDFLIKVRNQLHYLSGRKNDQLVFEYQEELARKNGFYDGEGLLGIERFMRELYGHLRTVSTTTDLFFEHVEETFTPTALIRGKQKLEPGVFIRNQRIWISEAATPEEEPGKPMRLFLHAAESGFPLHHRTRRWIAANLHLVDDGFRTSPERAREFMRILTSPHGPVTVLAAMLETGFLTAYLPEFEQIRSLAQHDVYHVFPVDRHLVETTSELRRITAEFAEAQRVERMDLLYLAALCHDIGKGSHTNHSERGALLMATIAKRLGLDTEETALLSFLVRHHLLLTTTALRRDLDDQEVIQTTAQTIGDQTRLLMLYLLSIADARATGPAAWNEWKGALLQELYLKLDNFFEVALSEGELADESANAAWIRERLTKAVKDDQDLRFMRELPDEYLLSFSAAAIKRHLKLRHRLCRSTMVMEHSDLGPFWQILILAQDQQGLLAKICGVLALHNLEVVSAQVFTWPDGTAADLINVRSGVGLGYHEQDWKEVHKDLRAALENRLGISHRLMAKQFRCVSGSSRGPVAAQAKVVIDNESSSRFTIIEVFAPDRTGLLYSIARTLADFGVSIHHAKLTVHGGQAVDVFSVSDPAGAKVTDPELLEEMKNALGFLAAGQEGLTCH